MSAVAEADIQENLDQEQAQAKKTENLPIQPQKDAPRGFFVDPREVYAKKQVRKNFGDLAELAGSIRDHKQKQPCVVFPKDDTGKYPLYVGERRWRACLESNQMLWVVEQQDIPSGTDIKIGQLIENIERESLSPIELGQGIVDLMEETNQSQEQVSKLLNVAPKFVSIHVACCNLPPCVEDAFHAEDITNPDTLVALKRLHEIDPERCEKLCARASEEGLTRAMAEKTLKDARATKGKVEAEQNKEKSASFGNADQEAEREHQRELKESGLDEKSEHMELDETGEGSDPDGELDLEDSESQASCQEASDTAQESAYPEPAGGGDPDDPYDGLVTKEGWIERDPKTASILCSVIVDGKKRTGCLAIDRYDPDETIFWVRIGIDKEERYIRVPAAEVTLIKNNT